MIDCPNCHTKLPDEARFCFNCGHKIGSEALEAETSSSSNGLNWQEDLVPQLEELFISRLEKRIGQIGDPNQINAYRERLYRSGFRDTAHHRLQQLADELERAQSLANFNPFQAQFEIDRVLINLVDFFLIREANDLHPFALPEAILKYQESKWETVNLSQMIGDFLALAQEELNVVTDLLIMQKDKLRNAGRQWLFPARDEKILLICDLSVFGSWKEGFGLTEEAIYWKNHLQTAQAIPYKELDSLELKRDWLLINQKFFHASSSLDIKLFLLLEKFKALQD